MTIPYVSTDLQTGQERQHRTQIAIATNELIKVRPPHDRTAAEVTAGVTPVNYSYAPGDVRRYGATMDGVTDDTAALTRAISVASQGGTGSSGAYVLIPIGTLLISSTVTLPKDVRILGVNKDSTVIQAKSGFTGTSMFLADNGASSMFDSLLENLTVDANSIASLSCIQTNAWQENCGTRGVLLYRFTTNGIFFSQTGYSTSGGAAMCRLQDTEIFGLNSTSGVNLEQISAVGSFVLDLENITISGSVSHPLPKGVDIAKDSSIMKLVHVEACTTGIFIDGVGSHMLINCTGESNVTTLVEIASTFTGTLTMIGCRRAGATNFLKDNRVGGYGTISGTDIQHLHIGTANRAITADNTIKAWCVFDGTTVGTNAPTKGFNVTSVTRNASGDYTVTFTNALTNVNAKLDVMTNLDTADSWWAADNGFGAGSANFTIRRGGAFAGAKVSPAMVSMSVIGFGT